MQSDSSSNDFSLLNILYKYMGLLLGLIWPLLLILKDIELSIFPQIFSVVLTIIFFNIISIKSLLRNKALLISKTFIGLSNVFLITLLVYYTGGYESNLWIMFIFPLITISLICSKKTLLLATLAISTILICFHLGQIKGLQITHFGWLLLKIGIFFTVSTLFKKVVDMEKDYEIKFRTKSKELHRSKDYISNILESMLDCLIVVDPDNRIKTVNHATLNLLGYEKEEEIIGQNANIIFSDKTFLDKNLSKVLFQKGAVRDCDLIFLTKKNEQIPVNFNASTIKNESGQITGIVGITRDLRAIKELVEELREAEKEIKEYSISLEKKVLLRTKEIETLMAEEKSKMESMIKSMTEGVIMTDEDGELIFLNPIAKKTIGMSSKENSRENQVHEWANFRNIYLTELYSEISSLSPIIKDIKLSQAPHTHLKVILSQVKNHKEERLGVVTLLSDVTKEKKLEQMKMEFISLISHELRTPLTNMKGFSSIMLNEISGKINEEQREYLLIIEDNINRLARIISNLLDLSRIETGKMQLDKTALDFPPIVEKAITFFNIETNKKNITVNTDFRLNLPNIYADSDKITQVFTNLIGNAIKFTPTNGTITISIREKGDFIETTVQDTGIGIAAENFDKIFEKFKHIDSSNDSFFQGAGLGLPITKDIIQLHSGKIHIESELGKGSKFIFTLPKYKPGLSTSKIQPFSTQKNTEEKPEQKKILLVDDEPTVVKSLQIRLENDNYKVITAYNGTEGLIKAKKEFPDIIILDVIMPEMNGYEVCRELWEDEKTHFIPVIMLTALGQIKDKLTGYASGTSEYMIKPFDYEMLAQKIKKILDIH